MKLLLAIFLLIGFRGYCQYDFLIDSLKLTSSQKIQIIEGRFLIEKNKSTIDHYKFSNHNNYQILYYPPKDGHCGIFEVNHMKFSLENIFNYNLGCDLDYGSFNVYFLKYFFKKYLIITAINYGSGSSTRNIFCNLFDVTTNKIKYYGLQSMYGSGKCFGGFSNDSSLDFIKIYPYKTNNDPDIFVAQVLSLDSSENKFKTTSKRIVFKREYTQDSFKISVLEKNW